MRDLRFPGVHTTTREALYQNSESNLVSSFIWARTYIIANGDSRALLAGSKLAAPYVNCDFLDWPIEHLSSSVVEVVVVDSKPIPAINRNYSDNSVSISFFLELSLLLIAKYIMGGFGEDSISLTAQWWPVSTSSLKAIYQDLCHQNEELKLTFSKPEVTEESISSTEVTLLVGLVKVVF